MKTRDKIIVGVTSLAALGFLYYLTRKNKTRKMLNQIADEGYETAYDILFPAKKQRSGPGFNNLSMQEIEWY